MRIVLINDSFPPQIDGVCNTVINYAKYLVNHGHEVIVTVPYYPKVVDDYPFEVWRYPSLSTEKMIGYRAGFPFAQKTMKHLSRFKPDLIHSHCPFTSTLLARELRDLTHAPLILTYHTKFDIDVRRSLKFKPLQNPVINEMVRNVISCDEVWAVNDGAGQNLKSLGYEGEYLVMPNGVDIDPSPCKEESLKAITEQYHLEDDVPLFLFVGRVIWYKGLHYSLEGLAHLHEKGYPFRLAVVGKGENLEEVIEESKRLGIYDQCIFPGPVYDRDILKAWYTKAFMFLLPSVFDNNPLVVKEAASCRTPSVLVRDSSSAEGVTHMENGFLIEESTQAMIPVLEWAVQNPDEVRKIGQKAAETLYVSWDNIIGRAVERYEEILEKQKAGQLPPHLKPKDNPIIRTASRFYRIGHKQPE